VIRPMHLARLGVEAMDEPTRVAQDEQVVFDRDVVVRAMDLLLEFDFAVAVPIRADVFPYQARIRVGNRPLALRWINRLHSVFGQWLSGRIDRQFATDIARLGWIDADQPTRPFAMLRVSPAGNVDLALVVHGRRVDVVAVSVATRPQPRGFEIDVELPNELARGGLERPQPAVALRHDHLVAAR